MANNPLEERLSQLKSQYESGRKQLEQLQQRENEIQVTLLKISGAVQVLEEEIQKAQSQQQG
jgi:DNA repair exonuclease SbcCD ATPase subunit